MELIWDLEGSLHNHDKEKRLFAISDEKHKKQELVALSIYPRIYLFNLVSCLCYALNHVFDG